MQEYTSRHKKIFSVLAANNPGVLLRVTGLFARRGFNIDSLVASTTQHPEVSRISLVVSGEDSIHRQVTCQLLKMEDILKVEMMDSADCSASELLLCKVNAPAESRSRALLAVQAAGGRVLDIGDSTITVEMSGRTGMVDDFVAVMEELGIVEMTRTGLSALERGDNSIHNTIE